MIGHIDNSRLIRFGFILNIDGVIIRQLHSNRTLQVTGKSFFSVLCQISQLYLLIVLLYSFVYTVLETFRSTMQTMTIVILWQLVLHTIQCEAPLVDAVGISSNACSEVGRIFDIVLYRVESQNHILHVTIFIGNHDRYNTASEISDANFHVVFVLQHKQVCLFTIDFCLEIASLQSGFSQFFFCCCGTSNH